MPSWTVSIKDNPKTPAKVNRTPHSKDFYPKPIRSYYQKRTRPRVRS